MSRGDGDFLFRWSARKAKARVQPESEAAPPVPLPEPVDTPAPAQSDEEILRELGLPDPATLVKGDDFAAFLRAGVPARLRNRALRRLWASDPVLANLDGLNDYDGDYTAAATGAKNLTSAYRVGLGYLRDNAPKMSAAAAEAVSNASEPTLAETPSAGAPAPEPQASTCTDQTTAFRRPEGAPGRPAGDGTEPPRTGAGVAAAPEPAREVRPRRMEFRFRAWSDRSTAPAGGSGGRPRSR